MPFAHHACAVNYANAAVPTFPPDALPVHERERAHATMVVLDATIEALRAEGRA